MAPSSSSILVFGGSGYAGLELCRLLREHPDLQLLAAASERHVGQPVPGGVDGQSFVGEGDALQLASRAGAALLATPAEVSLRLVPLLLSAGVPTLVDLSGAFRLRDPATFQRAYRLAPPPRELLELAHYGLPELTPPPPSAKLIANPGCYATAAALALAPLCEAGILDEEAVVIDAASGVTGAGRKATEELSFAEVSEDFRAYRVLAHQHQPEMAQTLSLAAGRRVALTFTPHLLPVRRGILLTAYARLRPGVSASAAQDALLHKYSHQPCLQIAAHPDQVSLRAVTHTPLCQLSAAATLDGEDPRRVVVVAALDNLLKGAASQAIQNLNLSRGLPPSRGLLRASPP